MNILIWFDSYFPLAVDEDDVSNIISCEVLTSFASGMRYVYCNWLWRYMVFFIMYLASTRYIYVWNMRIFYWRDNPPSWCERITLHIVMTYICEHIYYCHILLSQKIVRLDLQSFWLLYQTKCSYRFPLCES